MLESREVLINELMGGKNDGQMKEDLINEINNKFVDELIGKLY